MNYRSGLSRDIWKARSLIREASLIEALEIPDFLHDASRVRAHARTILDDVACDIAREGIKPKLVKRLEDLANDQTKLIRENSRIYVDSQLKRD